MTTDENYDDLTALFQDQDKTLEADTFTHSVMRRVNRSKQMRRIFLSIAGGVGALIALPQMINAYASWPLAEGLGETSMPSLQEQFASLQSANPVWLGAAGLILFCVMVASSMERA